MTGKKVVLVNDKNESLGLIGKIAAHKKGLLHRAFSIFVFNREGELIIQQRAFDKYHSGGLWANTCCGHQNEGQTTLEAAHIRLQEEMGFDTSLVEVFSFIYNSKMKNGLYENEYDFVL